LSQFVKKQIPKLSEISRVLNWHEICINILLGRYPGVPERLKKLTIDLGEGGDV